LENSYFHPPFISNTKSLELWQTAEIFLKQLLPQQLLHCNHSKALEKLKILQNPRKLTNQLYFNLNFGMQANVAAWDVLKNNGKALDAVEAGVKFRRIQKERSRLWWKTRSRWPSDA
jgi:hypothetical protein